MSANTPILHIGQNTTRPELTYTLTDQNGQAINLADASEVVLTTRHHRTGLIETDGQSVDIVAPQGGEIRYQFSPVEIPLDGRYDAQFVITYENGDTRAVPAGSEWFPFISVARNLPREKMSATFSDVNAESISAEVALLGALDQTLDANGERITGLPDPTDASDAVPQRYVDDLASSNITGMSNPATADFDLNNHALLNVSSIDIAASNPHNLTASEVNALPTTGGAISGDAIWTPGYRPLLQFNAGGDSLEQNAVIEFIDASVDNRVGWFGWVSEASQLQITNQQTGTTVSVGESSSINGNEIWHEGNDGDGSGLDADFVDGQEASELGGSSESYALGDLTNVTASGEGSGGGFNADQVDGYEASELLDSGGSGSGFDSGDFVHVATTSGGVADGTFSISATSYTDVDNDTTADLAAQDFSQIPTYSWDDGATYVSVSVVVDASTGTAYIVPLDTQNDVRLTGGETSTTTSGFHGVTTTPVAHSPSSSNTRWSFAIRSDGTSIAYGKNRTINFYRRVP